ncbi:S-adenosyl-L-methionine-dependent methyltransferase [Copromyces sp. CBS 386.78]|nr:S-adenosyl-L-methionine-dependent methyltransferase [Copromyces sp. CBS 386.78]
MDRPIRKVTGLLDAHAPRPVYERFPRRELPVNDFQTVPVDETYRDVILHHNREYQRYAVEHGVYFSPVDDDEIEYLQYIHGLFDLMFERRLIFPPIPQPRRILDCGSGSASWAIDVAEQHPECEVIGLDIYPYPMPEDLPANLELQIDDLNSPSTFPSNHFDLVHSRLMSGGIHANRWMNYLTDVFRILRPGGWCQMVEIYFNAQSDNGTLTPNHALQVWSQSYIQSVQPYKDPRAALRLQQMLTEVGFVEVETRLVTLPLCGWSNDPRDHTIGEASRTIVHRMLSSLCAYPFTQVLGMSQTDVQLLVAQARSEADNPAFKVANQVVAGSRATLLMFRQRTGSMAMRGSGLGIEACLEMDT